MDLELTRRRLLGGVAALGTLATSALVLTYKPPRVVDVSSEFGSVRAETADVRTRIVVDNPNDRGIPGGHTIEYEVSLNDVVVATGAESGVRIGPSRTVVETTTRFDNTSIPAWWVGHVNGDERTTMRTRSWVRVGGLPLRIPLSPEEMELSTSLLDTLGESEPSTVVLGDREILTIDEQSAEWGRADDEVSPLSLQTTLENVHDRPVAIDGTNYEIRMNDVVVGSGQTTERTEVAPGETATLAVDAAIQTQRMQQWWVTHLRNGQSTTLHIEVFAVVNDEDGTARQLPVAVLDQQSRFETDMLGTGETHTEPLESAPQAEFTDPYVEETSSAWGEVRDDETDIETTVTIRNENDDAFSDLLSLEVEQETSIAGIPVATGSDSISTLPDGAGQLDLRGTKAHAVVPQWWASHLENGEHSTTRTAVTGEADVAVTTLSLDLDDRETSVETGLLDDLNDQSTQTVTSNTGGQTLLLVHSTTAEWVDPTPEDGPIRVEADMENVQPEALTIGAIDSVIEINGVTLADERSSSEYTFAPRERKTVVFRLSIDNSRMEQWWPTHVRNGERSELERRVTATIETSSLSERMELDFLSETLDVETDLLADA